MFNLLHPEKALFKMVPEISVIFCPDLCTALLQLHNFVPASLINLYIYSKNSQILVFWITRKAAMAKKKLLRILVI